MSVYNNCHYWNGTVFSEWWTTDGVSYREDDKGYVLPSYIAYDEDGNVERETYHNRLGIVHRSDGPAEIEYDLYGYIVCEIYFINGVEVSYYLYVMIINMLNMACKRYKTRKRQKIFNLLRSKIYKLNNDICRVVTNYIY
jgi:hypothetical protein